MTTDLQQENTEQAHGPMEAEKMEIIDNDQLDTLLIKKEREWLMKPFEPYYDMSEEDDEAATASIEFKKRGREEIIKTNDEEIKQICKRYWLENEDSRKQDFDEEELEYTVNIARRGQMESESKEEYGLHENKRIKEMMEKDMGTAKGKIREILTIVCYRKPEIASQWLWYKVLQEIIEEDEVKIVLGQKTSTTVWIGRIYNDEGYRYYMKCKKNQDDIPEIGLRVTTNGYITDNNELINIEDTMISRMAETMLNKKQLVTARRIVTAVKLLSSNKLYSQIIALKFKYKRHGIY
ncbi:hypothetical protein RFI_31723 [Reticulomyxa filosa]|uniref:Uncharacterized protein n=1 Tax=Reticulomyxa filosa TaxID=46433 RepID=X6LVL6_RETFI|nr:hypothetical protein RFI_31723 [Reticulomyxa filosa]|eukprot:ETO05674.1 hypothetical protein RFI_31723 [Reticulomyxa filosa]